MLDVNQNLQLVSALPYQLQNLLPESVLAEIGEEIRLGSLIEIFRWNQASEVRQPSILPCR